MSSSASNRSSTNIIIDIKADPRPVHIVVVAIAGIVVATVGPMQLLQALL